MKNFLLRGVLLISCFLCFNKTAYSQVDFYMNDLNVYVSSYGRIALYSLPDTIRQLARVTPLVGTGIGHVFDEREDSDIEDSVRLLESSSVADYEIYGSTNNNYSGLPPAVIVKMNVYMWQNQSSIIAKYTVINKETSPIEQTFGLEIIPELQGDYSGNDSVFYDPVSKLLTVHKDNALGFKILSGNITTLNTFMYYSDYNNDTTFWDWMTNGNITTQHIIPPDTPGVDSPVMIPALSPVTLGVGDSAVYYVAIGYGPNAAAMLAGMAQAQLKYGQITSVKPLEGGIPSDYSLGQNYPNPFNPATKIEYSVPKSGFVSLKVYNALGKEVATIVNSEMPAGKYVADFNASGLSSGVYFYTISSASFNQTMKMMLIK